MAVIPAGRPSTTGYRVRERFPAWTELELDLVTGRTHQIRVHLDAIGHPIAGDPVYGTGTSRKGPDGLHRMFLHAWRLELAAPSDGHLIRATAELPPELESVLGGPARGGRALTAADEPDDDRAGARMRCWSSSRARAGSGRTRSSMPSGERPHDPDYHYVVDLHDAGRAPR